MKIDIQKLRRMMADCPADDSSKWGTPEYRRIQCQAHDLLPTLLDIYEASCKLVDARLDLAQAAIDPTKLAKPAIEHCSEAHDELEALIARTR